MRAAYYASPQPGCDNGYLNHGRVYGPNAPDLMGYGPAAWISGYSYKKIFDSIPPRTASTSSITEAERNRVDASAGKAFVISGSVSPSTVVASLTSVYTSDVSGSITLPSPGDWTISIKDSQGNQLANYSFQPTGNLEGGDLQVFSLAVPWTPDARSLVLLHSGRVMATRQASANLPVIKILSPNGGEALSGQSATFSWTASDADGDPLTYIVDYSTDGGATWKALAVDWRTTSYPVDLTRLRKQSGADTRNRKRWLQLCTGAIAG